jgi:hypothetical protein
VLAVGCEGEDWLYQGQRTPSTSSVFNNAEGQIKQNNILPVVLYGFETCYLTLKEEHKLQAFESKVVRKVPGHQKVELSN